MDKEILQLQCNALTLINLIYGMKSRENLIEAQYQPMIQDGEAERKQYALEAIYSRITKKTKEHDINPFGVSIIDKNAVIKLLSRGEELPEPS
jgi:hypothetical protein